MKFEVLIEPRAIIDINTIAAYYEEQQINLGFRFTEELESVLSTLELNPYFQIRYTKYRFLPLKKFPFIIVFKVNEKVGIVSVYSVFHTSQNPKKLPK